MKAFTVKDFKAPGNLLKNAGTQLGYMSAYNNQKKNKMIAQKNFSRSAINSTALSLVQFTMEWNGASQIVSMIFDDLAKSYNGTADFYAVNFEKEKSLSKELGVMEAPTILFFKNGQLIDHAVGLIAKNALIEKIETALSNSNNK